MYGKAGTVLQLQASTFDYAQVRHDRAKKREGGFGVVSTEVHACFCLIKANAKVRLDRNKFVMIKVDKLCTGWTPASYELITCSSSYS